MVWKHWAWPFRRTTHSESFTSGVSIHFQCFLMTLFDMNFNGHNREQHRKWRGKGVGGSIENQHNIDIFGTKKYIMDFIVNLLMKTRQTNDSLTLCSLCTNRQPTERVLQRWFGEDCARERRLCVGALMDDGPGTNSSSTIIHPLLVFRCFLLPLILVQMDAVNNTLSAKTWKSKVRFLEKTFMFHSQSMMWASVRVPTDSVPTTQSQKREVGTIAL